jgi:hypothetical protein
LHGVSTDYWWIDQEKAASLPARRRNIGSTEGS